MIETLKNVSVVTGAIIGFCTVVTLIVKPLRTKVVDWVKRTSQAEDHDALLNEIKQALAASMDERKAMDDRIIAMVEEQAETSETMRVALRGMIRNTITHLYFKYISVEELPSYEHENLIGLFDAYKALGGNSYIDTIYSKMMLWKVRKLVDYKSE